MFKSTVTCVKKNGINLVCRDGKKPRRFKPWLGDFFSFVYDPVMERSIFPKKFRASLERHYSIMKSLMDGQERRRLLELGTGTGSAALFLHPGTRYVGTDVSPGLLRRAVRRFAAAGFAQADFYLVPAEDLVFANAFFDTCLCVLALNFFHHLPKVLCEVHRILAPDGVFVCCVPVPERVPQGAVIRGTLYSQDELAFMCREQGFDFILCPETNGALLYFRAARR